MFCEKCGKEISKYEVCGSEVSTGSFHERFDKKTGEEWRSVNVENDFRCRKWNHKKIIWTKWQVKKTIPTRRSNSPSCLLVLKKYLNKDGSLIIGTCKSVCCPHCGVIK